MAVITPFVTTTPTTLPGEGTKLAVKITPAVTYTVIGNRTTMTGPRMEVAKIATTNLDSPTKTYRPSRQLDPGEFDLTIWYDPNETSAQQFLRSQVNPGPGVTTAPALLDFQLTYNDGKGTTSAVEQFFGFVTSWEENGMDEDSNLAADITIAVTSGYTLTQGT
jgi:hypothetical protein